MIGLLLAVLRLFLFSAFSKNLLFSGFSSSPLARLFFWSLVSCFLLLTWLGRCPAESPYTEVALRLTVLYFFLMLSMSLWAHVTTFAYLK